MPTYPELFPVSSSILGTSALAARQAAVAAQYGANADEIVLSYNTTDACNLIFAGTPWNPGDRIVTTQWEHPALEGPIAWARTTCGVTVKSCGTPFQLHLRPSPCTKSWIFSDETQRGAACGSQTAICGLQRDFLQKRVKDAGHRYFAIWPGMIWGLQHRRLPPTAGASCPSIAMPTGPTSLPAPATSGSAAVPAPASSMSGIPATNLPPFAMGNFFLYANGDLPSQHQPQF